MDDNAVEAVVYQNEQGLRRVIEDAPEGTTKPKQNFKYFWLEIESKRQLHHARAIGALERREGRADRTHIRREKLHVI